MLGLVWETGIDSSIEKMSKIESKFDSPFVKFRWFSIGPYSRLQNLARISISTFVHCFLSLRGVFHYVACFTTWRVSLRGVFHYVAYLLRGVFHYVAYFTTWRISLRGVFHYVACFTKWRIALRGVFHYVACFTTWRVSLRGVFHYVACFKCVRCYVKENHMYASFERAIA